MALPASGQISVSQIRTEFQQTGRNNYSFSEQMLTGYAFGTNDGYTPINIASPNQPSSTNPDSISEWYSYNHTASNSCDGFYNLYPGQFPCTRVYRIINISGTAGLKSLIQASANINNSTYVYRIYDVYPFTNTGAFVATSPIFSGTASTTQITHIYTSPSTSVNLHFVAFKNDCL